MRKLLIVLVAVGLVQAGMLFALVMPRHCPVNREACKRIKKGMTQSEVEKILGGPPGDCWDYDNHQTDIWNGDDGDVTVFFVIGKGVVKVDFWEANPGPDPSTIELLRWRLKRLKERLLP
jgi:hypothetical protein